MDGVCCETSFGSTHDRLAEFVAIGRHITSGIESLHRRLLSLIDDEASFPISLWIHMIDKLGIWR